MIENEIIVSKEMLDEIPNKTGVYIFSGKYKDESKISVLYVGKAKNLHARVRQYFSGEGDGRPFIKFLQKRVDKISYIVVKTEQDALLLENELIKKYWPRYNIHLKDDKRYLSLRLDLDHQWPKIDIVRKIKKDKAVYLGPFSSSSRLKMTLDFMQKIFPLRTCTDHKLYNRSRPCIEYDIKRCVAPCVDYVSKKKYDDLVNEAVLFLRGDNEELLKALHSEMESVVKGEDFEEAAKLRDKIQSISTTTQAQGVIGLEQGRKGEDLDVIGIAQDEAISFIIILFCSLDL